jgi:hypothetical protein
VHFEFCGQLLAGLWAVLEGVWDAQLSNGDDSLNMQEKQHAAAPAAAAAGSSASHQLIVWNIGSCFGQLPACASGGIHTLLAA